jgi:hypothetical protein
MEDDLKKTQKMEDDLNKNGRQTIQKCKKTYKKCK